MFSMKEESKSKSNSEKKRKKVKIRLGDRVKDKVTGFVGIVTSHHKFLHGCVRLGVQPPLDRNGKVPDPMTFDEPQLEVLEEEVAKEGNRKTGGPAKFVPGERVEGG